MSSNSEPTDLALLNLQEELALLDAIDTQLRKAKRTYQRALKSTDGNHVRALEKYGCIVLQDKDFLKKLAARYMPKHIEADLENVSVMHIFDILTHRKNFTNSKISAALSVREARPYTVLASLFQKIASKETVQIQECTVNLLGSPGERVGHKIVEPLSEIVTTQIKLDDDEILFKPAIESDELRRKLSAVVYDKDGIPSDACDTQAVVTNKDQSVVIVNESAAAHWLKNGGALRLGIPGHTVFMSACKDAEGNVRISLNDPNYSSLQQVEQLLAKFQPMPSKSGLLHPGGWCQTWSAFQLECDISKSNLHAELLDAFNNSRIVTFKGATPAYATDSEAVSRFIELFASKPIFRTSDAAEVDFSHGTLSRTELSGTWTAWADALTNFVRCLALRNLSIISKLAPRK